MTRTNVPTSQDASPEFRGRSDFPSTLWTVVREASERDDDRGQEALGRLCALYREPARWWLVRSGTDLRDADDMVQAFVEDLLQENRIRGFQRREARFRSFIIECLKRFRRGEWRRGMAAKRGAGQVPASLDDLDVPDGGDHRSELDAQFALAVHRRACQRVRDDYAGRGREERFDRLRTTLLGQDDHAAYEELGRLLGLTSNAVKKAVFDLRAAYYDAFRSEILELTSDDAWMEEMRYLLTLLLRFEARELWPPCPGVRL